MIDIDNLYDRVIESVSPRAPTPIIILLPRVKWAQLCSSSSKYISCCSDISMANRSVVMQLNCCSSTLMTLCSAQAFHVLMAHFVAFSVLGGTACFWAFSMSFAWNAVAKRNVLHRQRFSVCVSKLSHLVCNASVI